MLKTLSDILPKEVLLAGVAYGAIAYFVAAPELAARVARADYIPACMAEHRDAALSLARQQAEALSHTPADPKALLAEHQLRILRDNPAMQELERSGLATVLGLDTATDLAFAQIEAKKRAAEAVIAKGRTEIEQATRIRLEQSNDLCTCATEQAFEESRGAWAVFAGSLGLVRPEPVRTFGEKVDQHIIGGACSGAEGGAS